MRIEGLTILATLLTFPNIGWSENNPLLKGITEVEILVESITDTEKECGIDDAQIHSELAYTVGRDIKVVKEANCYVYANPNISQTTNKRLCYGSLELELRCFGRFVNSSTNNEAFHTSTLWDSKVSAAAHPDHFKPNYLSIFTKFAKELVVEWRQNQ